MIAETTDAQSTADQTDSTTTEQPPAEQPPQAGEEARESRAASRRSELEREGEIAADFLETLLDIADLDGDLEVDVDGDRAAVSIVDSEDGAAPRRLVGADATVLEALQELTRLAVQAETGDRSRLMLDVAGHRAQRRTALVEQAREVIETTRSTGERQELEPMSAFERKVVHDEVLKAGLRSESEGEEPHRFVVVLPAS
jgi:spoIIIJ-associated protein